MITAFNATAHSANIHTYPHPPTRTHTHMLDSTKANELHCLRALYRLLNILLNFLWVLTLTPNSPFSSLMLSFYSVFVHIVFALVCLFAGWVLVWLFESCGIDLIQSVLFTQYFLSFCVDSCLFSFEWRNMYKWWMRTMDKLIWKNPFGRKKTKSNVSEKKPTIKRWRMITLCQTV